MKHNTCAVGQLRPVSMASRRWMTLGAGWACWHQSAGAGGKGLIVVVAPLELGTQRKKKTYLPGELALIHWDNGAGRRRRHRCRGTEVVIIVK